MAKLSSRGRRCVGEAIREYTAEQLHATAAKHGFLDANGLPLTKWERAIRRLMSDGTILEKRDVQFQPDWLDKDGRKHSYGWKVHGKLKAGLTPADWIRVYSQPRKDGSPSSWRVSDHETTPGKAKVISIARIERAVRRDDHTGFCTACGAEQGGTEPDANGYRCESCGQMAVSGAENLLLEMA